MDSFLSDLVQQIIQMILLAGAALIVIWFYFRLRGKPQADRLPLPSEQKREDGTVIALRLQAYERLILYLERISPNNLILRVSTPDMTALQLQAALIRTIREEFEYNLSQQLYLSSGVWERIRHAKEEMIREINAAAANLKKEAMARDLAGAILQLSLSQERSPVKEAIEGIKEELGQL